MTELGAHWQARAHDECASIPAFLQLAAELLDLGAPDFLVQRALDAAADELRHTRMATRLAQQFGAPNTAPTPPAYRRRAILPRRAQLTRLAHESWMDGCLGEGAAAAIAGAEAAETNDRHVQTIQRAIHQDESAHAGLARDVLRWTLAQDSSIAKTVRAERLRELSMSSMILTKEDSLRVLRSSHESARDLLDTLT